MQVNLSPFYSDLISQLKLRYPEVPVDVSSETAGISDDCVKVFQSTNTEIAGMEKQLAHEQQSHYEASRKLIVKGAQGLKGEALIVGIGNAIDIPFNELAKQFERVTVVELDPTSVTRALGRLEPEQRSKVSVIIGDLTGSLAKISSALQLLNQSKDLNKSIEAVHKVLPLLKPLTLRILQGHKFDYVVSNLVLTQINGLPIHYIRSHLMKLYGERVNQVFLMTDLKASPAGIMSNAFQQQHLRDLHSWVKEEGKVYFADTFFEVYLLRKAPGAIPQPVSENLFMLQSEVVDLAKKIFQEDPAFTQEESMWTFNRNPPPQQVNGRGSSMKVLAFLYKPKAAAAVDPTLPQRKPKTS